MGENTLKPILLISFLVLLVIYFIPITINITLIFSKIEKYFRIQIVFLKFIKIPFFKNIQKVENQDIKYSISKYLDYIKILKKLNIKWDYLYLNGIYGFGDPAYTAITYGIIWSVLGTIITSFNIKKPVVELTPDCNKKVFKLHIEGIFSLTIGNIIRTGFFILKTGGSF